MIYIRSETSRQIMMAHRRQLRFRASRSSVFALFFILNAVSLILELFDTISYRCYKSIGYIEVLLIVDHFLDVFAHQFLRLVHDVLRLRDLVALFLVEEPTHDAKHSLSAVVEVGRVLYVTPLVQIRLRVHLIGDLLQESVGISTFKVAVGQNYTW